MADITNEEHLDNPANTQSENPANEIPPAAGSETINLNQETKNMEVHHRAHHEGKKSWKSYFWEFLMLFLAVFCGFLAEYQLDHTIEKERGMQYIHSFYNDLKTDTAAFAKNINRYEIKMDALSKANECYDSISRNIGKFCPCISKLIKYSSGFLDFVNADQTLLQLKNAGGLRLLKQEDADSILSYDKEVSLFLKIETTGFQVRQYRIRESVYSILNYKSLMSKKVDPTIPIFITKDPVKINEFFVILDDYINANNGHLIGLKKLNQKAIGIIKYLKDKYHYE